MISNVSKKI